MTDIGIYGDSFALDGKHSWINYLRKNLKSKITSYGKAGTDLMFSYSNFLKNYKNHTLNIFVLTESSRDEVFLKDKSGNLVYKKLDEIDNKAVIEGTIKKRALYPMSWYYRTIAVTDSLKLRDSKVIIINGMDENYSDSCLIHVQRLDGYKFFKNFPNLETNDRYCHMSVVQNKEFAGYLTRHILEGFDVFQTLMAENVSKYYTQSTTKQEAGFR